MKHIYLIRHGETDANKERIHQSSDEGLNVKGRLQAHHAAHTLELLSLDTLIASPFVRARETAMILSEHLHIPYTLHESVVEIRRPSFIYGQSYTSLDTFFYFLRLFKDREHPRWEYDGAENMFALRNRIAEVKNMLERTDGERIGVVSHDVFMNLFMIYICKNNRLSLRDFIRLIVRTRRTPNTAIMHFIVEENPKPKTCNWQFVEAY